MKGMPSIRRRIGVTVCAFAVGTAWVAAGEASAAAEVLASGGGTGGGALGGARSSAAPLPNDGAGSGRVPARLPLPFIEDDYPRASAEARRTHRPLFVDAWAPWCHTCLSLRAFVFTAPELRPLRERFVWAAVDTENPVNARFVDTHPIDAWPTLFVVDEHTGATRRLYRGALRPSELVAWLLGADGTERAAEQACQGRHRPRPFAETMDQDQADVRWLSLRCRVRRHAPCRSPDRCHQQSIQRALQRY